MKVCGHKQRQQTVRITTRGIFGLKIKINLKSTYRKIDEVRAFSEQEFKHRDYRTQWEATQREIWCRSLPFTSWSIKY
jgi:hypothetical protein